MRSTVLLALTEKPSFEGALSVRLVEEQNPEGRATYSLACQKDPPFNSSEVGLLAMALRDVTGEDREELTKSVSWRVEVSLAKATELTDILTGLAAVIVPQSELGLDGTFYELLIERGFNKVQFAWWSEPPVVWKSLGDLSKKLLASANAELMIEAQQSDKRKRLIERLGARLIEEQGKRETAQAESFVTHNGQCHELERSLKATGLTCPLCHQHSKEIRFIDRSPNAKSYFICKNCGRSFRPEDFASAQA
jgi:hypothetical protein